MMNERLSTLLKELAQFGEKNDASVKDRSRKMLNVTPDTGEFLVLLIRALKAQRVLEIGTSNGYSTLWLAQAVHPSGGKITTLEISPYKADMARANFARSGLQDRINLNVVEAGRFIKQQAEGSFDFVFLDSDREQYVSWWRDLQRILATGGLLVVDNAVSHPREMEGFVQAVRRTPGYITSTVPVGNGEFLILKGAKRA